MIAALLFQMAQVAPHADPAPMVGAGKLIGGWEYVYAGYGVAAFALIAYSLSLFIRWKRHVSANA